MPAFPPKTTSSPREGRPAKAAAPVPYPSTNFCGKGLACYSFGRGSYGSEWWHHITAFQASVCSRGCDRRPGQRLFERTSCSERPKPGSEKYLQPLVDNSKHDALHSSTDIEKQRLRHRNVTASIHSQFSLAADTSGRGKSSAGPSAVPRFYKFLEVPGCADTGELCASLGP